MDATRARRTRDRVRQAWYARWRQLRFARHLGFASDTSRYGRLAGTGPRLSRVTGHGLSQ